MKKLNSDIVVNSLTEFFNSDPQGQDAIDSFKKLSKAKIEETLIKLVKKKGYKVEWTKTETEESLNQFHTNRYELNDSPLFVVWITVYNNFVKLQWEKPPKAHCSSMHMCPRNKL